MINGLVKFLSTLNQVACVVLEFSGLPANIYKNNIAPLVRANLVQRIVAMIEGITLMHIGPANMRCIAKLAILIISPSVTGTRDRPTKLLCFADQNHAAMKANIFKGFDFIILITHQQHR